MIQQTPRHEAEEGGAECAAGPAYGVSYSASRHDAHADRGLPFRRPRHPPLRPPPPRRDRLFRVHGFATGPAPSPRERRPGPPVRPARPPPLERRRVRAPPAEDVPRPVRGPLPHPDLLGLRRPPGPDRRARPRGALPGSRDAVPSRGVLGGLPPPEGRRPPDDARRRPPRAREAPPLPQGAARPVVRRRPDPRPDRLPDGVRPRRRRRALRAAPAEAAGAAAAAAGIASTALAGLRRGSP